MRKSALLLCLAIGTVPAWSSTVGTAVTGSFTFTGFGTTNYFDPVNFFVPPSGYLNSVACGTPDCTVLISSSIPTFGYDDQVDNALSADFSSGNQLIIKNTNEGSGAVQGFTLTFTDPAFIRPTEVSDNFRRGGLALSFSGDTITLTYARGAVNTNSLAVFNIGGTTVPEPGTWAGMLSGTLLTIFARYRRRVTQLTSSTRSVSVVQVS